MCGAYFLSKAGLYSSPRNKVTPWSEPTCGLNPVTSNKYKPTPVGYLQSVVLRQENPKTFSVHPCPRHCTQVCKNSHVHVFAKSGVIQRHILTRINIKM